MEGADAFITYWRPVLESGALVKFAYGPRGARSGNHCQVADQLVATLGLKQIGFNWELLDAAAPEADLAKPCSEESSSCRGGTWSARGCPQGSKTQDAPCAS